MNRDLPPPAGLRATVVEINGESLVALSYPVDATLPMPGCLSDSEQAVVRLACGGLTSRQIATVRGVRHRTVCNQLASVYRKLGVHSRDGLIALLCTSRDRS